MASSSPSPMVWFRTASWWRDSSAYRSRHQTAPRSDRNSAYPCQMNHACLPAQSLLKKYLPPSIPLQNFAHGGPVNITVAVAD